MPAEAFLFARNGVRDIEYKMNKDGSECEVAWVTNFTVPTNLHVAGTPFKRKGVRLRELEKELVDALLAVCTPSSGNRTTVRVVPVQTQQEARHTGYQADFKLGSLMMADPAANQVGSISLRPSMADKLIRSPAVGTQQALFEP
ncbi:hypothetical protein HII31_12559 [Pseudocercospora fuligena]|uniref:Uncharacterized protein n=1 Tax=Pseudocercospora fuligena TaxID=685502 RepID=A0A8H6R7T3_9PEZI|nr:hypothetical protein HII31_12559 [Pseudocercospora fuligena]